MPMNVMKVNGLSDRFHVARKTVRPQIKHDRSMLNPAKTRTKRLYDMGGVDPGAGNDADMAKKTLGGMAAGAGIGGAIAGPLGAMAGALIGALGGATIGLFGNKK